MSLDYFLSCKKEYIKIVQHLEYIIQTLDTIHYISLNEIPNNCNQENNNKSFFTYKIKHFQDLINNCNNNLDKLCCHNYVDDTIDIDEDRSQNITYCTICETVKTD
jgi:hypothetical protein